MVKQQETGLNSSGTVGNQDSRLLLQHHGLSFPLLAEHHRIDLTLSKRVLDDRGELTIGVSDLLNETEMSVVGLGTTVNHDTPGRTFFVRAQIQF